MVTLVEYLNYKNRGSAGGPATPSVLSKLFSQHLGQDVAEIYICCMNE